MEAKSGDKIPSQDSILVFIIKRFIKEKRLEMIKEFNRKGSLRAGKYPTFRQFF